MRGVFVVVEKVRPHRLDGHGEARRLLKQIDVWLEVEDPTVAKVRDSPGRQGSWSRRGRANGSPPGLPRLELHSLLLEALLRAWLAFSQTTAAVNRDLGGWTA